MRAALRRFGVTAVCLVSSGCASLEFEGPSLYVPSGQAHAQTESASELWLPREVAYRNAVDTAVASQGGTGAHGSIYVPRPVARQTFPHR